MLQLKIYHIGEQLSDRIEFEELALKGVDPSLGPSLARPSTEGEMKPRVSERLRLSILGGC